MWRIKKSQFFKRNTRDKTLAYLYQEKYNLNSVIGIVSSPHRGVAQKIHNIIPEWQQGFNLLIHVEMRTRNFKTKKVVQLESGKIKDLFSY